MLLWAPNLELLWVTRAASSITSMCNSTIISATPATKHSFIQIWTSGFNLQRTLLKQGTLRFRWYSRTEKGLWEGGPRYSWGCRPLPGVQDIQSSTEHPRKWQRFMRYVRKRVNLTQNCFVAISLPGSCLRSRD